AAVIVSAGAFGLVHFQPDAFPTLFALGLILGLLRLRTRSIWPPIVLHAANNGLAFAYLLAT
ncbi:MAG: type II CAAX prenyl endopeptidase Rce1 family protein, partial [Gaiellales bacterium]